MTVLYIAGHQAGAGKTALAAALALDVMQMGHSAVVLKPLRVAGDGRRDLDGDSGFYKQLVPGNPQPEGWPLTVTPDQLATSPGALDGISERVKLAGAEADVTIVEGLDGLGPGSPEAVASAALSEELGARVIVAVRHDPAVGPDELGGARQTFGESLLGLVLNGVARYRGHEVSASLLPALEAAESPVLGVIPEDRVMLSPSVRDVAAHLDGEFRLQEERADELVESVMIGGFFLDPGDYVFSRREHKAVLVRADRPDLQMAALRTSTACLVLTGGQNPIQYVTYHAEQEEVPLVLVQCETLEAMERLHTVGERVTVHHARKARRFRELLERHCDVSALRGALAG